VMSVTISCISRLDYPGVIFKLSRKFMFLSFSSCIIALSEIVFNRQTKE